MRVIRVRWMVAASLLVAGCGEGDDRSGDAEASEAGEQVAPAGETADPPDPQPGEGEGEPAPGGEGEGEDAATPPQGGEGEGEGEGPPVIPDCEPLLSVDPFEAAVRPLDLLTFHASGGTGAYRFSLTDDGSGALLNEVTGAYLSGETTGVVDGVELRDEGCIGVARAEVRVVPPMAVRPAAAEVAPATSFLFEVADGSGQFAFLMASSRSGGQVSPDGRYTAGGGDGADVVRVADVATGEEAEVVIEVRAGAALRPRPVEVFVAVGSSHKLVVDGGSGHLDAAVAGAEVGFEDGVVSGLSPGVSNLLLTDHFTGLQTDVRVTTVRPQGIHQVRAGNAFGRSPVMPAGDIDGDGFDDVVLGLPEADVEAFNGGAVFVYAGGAPPPLGPARVISSDRRRTELGRSLAVQDFDGDGRVDLAVGAPLDDIGAGDNGGVYIYRGVAGRMFAETPSQVLVGPFGGDRYGHSLAACDFNGDGRPDLAVGAFLAEDRDADPRQDNQGGVFIHLGHPDGFLEEADDRVWGMSPDEAGQWSNHRDLRIGWSVAAGDFDGDGLCDLLTGSIEYRSANNRRNDGAAFLYLGRPAAGLSQGGLEPLPAYAFGGIDPDDASSQLARQVTMGDLDGDGLAEVVLGQYRSDNPDVGSLDHGAVRILRGRALPVGPANRLTPPAQMDWVWRGDNGYDNVGWTLRYQADPPLLIVGSLNDEDDDGPANTGTLRLFAGRQGELPDPAEAVVVASEVGGERFGQGGMPAGDMDGDGIEDLFVFAGYGDEYGYRVGTPWFLPGADGAERVALELPGEPSGAEVGRALAVVPDLDGDGFEELVVGAPRYDTHEQSFDAGAAFVFRGSADGFSVDPDLTLAGHPMHSGFDLMGQAAAPAGDFDGDGLQDLAVSALAEDRPNNFGGAYAPVECGPNRNDIGAVYVYRGQDGALPSATPSFALYGPAQGANPEALAGGLDIDGDRRGDMVIGARLHDPNGNDSGSVSVAWGRPYAGQGLIEVGCESEVIDEGHTGSGWLGWAVSPLGDLDGDGCDEFVVGAPREGPREIRREGLVYVYFGWDPDGGGGGGGACPAEPMRTIIGGGERDGQFGWGVSGGVDVDDDGLPDLAVSANGRVGNVANLGGAWLLPGSWLVSLPRQRFTPGTVQADDITTVDPGEEGVRRVVGDAVGQQFGSAVALLSAPARGSGGRVALGASRSAMSGTSLSGGVRLHAASDAGLNPAPLAEFGGEATRPEGLLGDRLAAGTLAGHTVLVVGGYDANGPGLDLGAAYVLLLE